MRAGDIVAGRFEIELAAGSGGMGQVYRALDRLTGERVALKVLRSDASFAAERFAREASVLATLAHPAIVRYVAYGITDLGEAYLVMEWLEGETLSARLARGRLALGEGLALARRLADALAAVHRRGFVHRDVKPSNVFLPRGSIRDTMLLDFGVARVAHAAEKLTAPGAVLGTPGYLAPEQARGEEVDARADVFALGCILFRGLAGRPAFMGDDILAVLLKVILESPPRLAEFRDDLPDGLDDLVERMLAKRAGDRPASGEAVAAELGALGEIPIPSRAPVSLGPSEITGTERRVMSLLLARYPGSGSEDPTLPMGAGERAREALRATVARHGGRFDVLADGSILVVLTSAGAATDLAVRAARCALAIRAQRAGSSVAVVSGRDVLLPDMRVGDLIDRSVRLLEAHGAGIGVDDVTAGLVGARFEIAGEGPSRTLLGERDAFEASRTLLGKPTACVGREREIAQLEGIFTQAVADRTPAAVLVTAPAGAGKTRLRDELLRKLRARGEAVEIWLAQGDPVGAGSPFGLLGQALRRAIGLRGGEPLAAQRQKVRARVERSLGDDAGRVAEGLGEIVGVPFPDDESMQLRAARRDPTLMGDQMRRAFEDFVLAEARAQPLLLVLEDLHWGDLPTVTFVEAALRRATEVPFVVLALAPPEVHEVFPKLWAGHEEMPLRPLTRRASERLVRGALGEAAPAPVVDAIVDRGEGHAFYLEELVRAVAEGKGAALPETVLSMVQARLDALDPALRRALRAASVFGQTFWGGGVAALLGRADPTQWLAALGEMELVMRCSEGRFPEETEYRFRHALVQEAAYGMFVEGDRTLGHRLAAGWLERAGEADAVMLGEHRERGGEPARAAVWYARAAQQAFEGNDLEAALGRAARGVACAADGELAGVLLVLTARAHRWRGQNAEASRAATEAMARLPRGSVPWCDAAGVLAGASGSRGDVARLREIARSLVTVAVDSAAEGRTGGGSPSHGIALARTAVNLLTIGLGSEAQAVLDRAEEVAQKLGDDPSVAAQIAWARSARALWEGDPWGSLSWAETARASFERSGDLRFACFQGISAAGARLALGDAEGAACALGDRLRDAERLGLPGLAAFARRHLGLALALLGRIDEGRAVEEQAVSAFRAQGDRRVEAIARIHLAAIHLFAGDPGKAAEEATDVAREAVAAPARAYAQAMLAAARLAEGRTAEALAAAREAHATLAALGGIDEGEALVRLVHAEALHAANEPEAARAAISEARARLQARAERIGDAALGARFCAAVPENLRTLELARRWLDG